MSDSDLPQDAEALFERLLQHIYSGDEPAIDVRVLNVMGALEDDDHPAAFICSFAGPDVNEETGETRVVHAILNGTQVARLIEQLTAAAIAEMEYAVTGENTEVALDGRIRHWKPEDRQ